MESCTNITVMTRPQMTPIPQVAPVPQVASSEVTGTTASVNTTMPTGSAESIGITNQSPKKALRKRKPVEKKTSFAKKAKPLLVENKPGKKVKNYPQKTGKMESVQYAKLFSNLKLMLHFVRGK